MKVKILLAVLFYLETAPLFALTPEYKSDSRNQTDFGNDIDNQSVVSDLPLKEFPPVQNNLLPLIFFISGDGGWSTFDHSLSKKLAEKGYPIVGLDSRKYFWKAKTLKEITDMVTSVLDYYSNKWKKKEFVLLGYSFGADVVPFITNNLPLQLSGKLKKTFCLSPGEYADFEIHISDMLSLGTSKDKYDVVAEVKKINPSQIVCLFGSGEDLAVRDRFLSSKAEILTLTGNHHYDDNYTGIADAIVEKLEEKEK